MQRREFCQQSLKSLGALFFSSTLMACTKNEILENTQFQGRVLIIGAGAAGLYAAKTLQDAGIDYHILEASDTYGGRLRKNDTFYDVPIDLGAQWIHGQCSLMRKLTRRNDVEVFIDKMDEFYWFDNGLVEDMPKAVNPFLRALYGSDNDISMLEYLQQEGADDQILRLAQGVATEAGTSLSRLSVAGWNSGNREWDTGGRDFLFKTTYFDLIDQYVAQDVKSNITYNTVIQQIDYTETTIKIEDTSGQIWECDRVLVTVPISILKDGDITFIPELPTEQTDAFQKIGMDRGMKIFMRFSQAFFSGATNGGAHVPSYVDATYKKEGNSIGLFAFVMGEQADALAALSPQDLQTTLLGELDEFYNGQASLYFEELLVQDWGEEPFIRGAYSYATVGMGNARAVAGQSVNQQIYFAGEAFHLETPSTVHGAAESGYEQVVKLLEDAS